LLLSACINASFLTIESEILRPAGGRGVDGLDRFNPRRSRATAQLTFEAIDGFAIALDQRLDAPIVAIADPARQPFGARRALGEESEPDALDAAAHDELARDQHHLSIEESCSELRADA
jgi:hypothetical protein